MKKTAQIISVLSFLLNAIYMAIGITVSLKYPKYADFMDHYRKFIPSFTDPREFSYFLVALTVIAIGLLLAQKRNLLFNFILVFEFLFMAVYAWGFM